MSNTLKGNGLKSAWELAMERMERENGGVRSLSEAQKKQIAEIDRKAAAKIAEVEIMMKERLLKADGNPEEVERITGDKKAETAKIQEKAEREKEKVRDSGGE